MFALIILLLSLITLTHAENPIRGYSAWNAFKRNFNETDLMINSDLMKTLGLVDIGYNYFNIDGSWWESKNKLVKRNPGIVESHTKFPSGMKYFSDHVHKNNQKFGLYTSVNTKSCFAKDSPMSYGHEKEDSQKFIDWGIDFIKLDNCGLPNNKALNVLKKWRNLLPENILISNCRIGCIDSYNYALQSWCSKKSDLYSMFRTSIDIKPNFKSIIHNIESTLQFGQDVIRDPDILEVGNKLSTVEEKTHLSLWAITSSPLLISTDLRNIKPALLELLKNKNMIDINQHNTEIFSTISKSILKITKTINNKNIMILVNKSNKEINVENHMNDNYVDVYTNKIIDNFVLLPHDSFFMMTY